MAIPQLTDKQLEILGLVAGGFSSKQIGRKLGIKEDTVNTHLKRVSRRLGTQGRFGAVLEAYRAGLLRLDREKVEQVEEIVSRERSE